MIVETDVAGDDGSVLHAYDLGTGELPVFWQHGSPNVGEPPAPLFAAAAERGIRWVSYDRPGYGGSSPRPGRDVASAAADTARVADALGLDRFAVVGHSGGGPHALACAAKLPDRVVAAVSGSGLAPFDADGLDWFAGLHPAGAAELRAAAHGRAAFERWYATSEFDPEQFTPADHAALAGEWGWLAEIAGKAIVGGPDGFVDDELAFTRPWGFGPEQIQAPVLFLHGDEDRMVPSSHSVWLAGRCRSAQLWRRPSDGHVSVLTAGPAVLDWLVEAAASASGR